MDSTPEWFYEAEEALYYDLEVGNISAFEFEEIMRDLLHDLDEYNEGGSPW